MERNPNDNLNSQSGSSSTGAGPESGYEAGSGAGSSSDTFGGSSFGSGSSGSGSFGGSTDSFADKAKDGLSDAKDKAKSGLSGAKDKATELKATLADKLEAGASKLRSQQTGASYAGASGGSPSYAGDQGQLGQLSGKLATGMEGTAEFLRNADIDQMKSGVEKQVRENPGRSLLIAAGLGYILGKVFRK